MSWTGSSLFSQCDFVLGLPKVRSNIGRRMTLKLKATGITAKIKVKLIKTKAMPSLSLWIVFFHFHHIFFMNRLTSTQKYLCFTKLHYTKTAFHTTNFTRRTTRQNRNYNKSDTTIVQNQSNNNIYPLIIGIRSECAFLFTGFVFNGNPSCRIILGWHVPN